MAKTMTIGMRTKGDFNNSFKFLRTLKERRFLSQLDKFGEQGVEALREATPKDSGLTADSWNYEITNDGSKLSLIWYNTNIKPGYYNVAIMIQYGHGTGTGGWVEGIDYINPALRPIFDQIEKDIWEEVRNS
ncbi:HK97 gp10 family phage protein [Lachnoclostridium sp. Marseille-P6806]|uniref:HK97 gp10 family phage protein n=1 Tax=Lachnoclostridium sp. Marseille-P6806 TaxID=2364793 RepID=UPI001F5F2156|nr:HK97 gp10 family phage protein [Lachnoclostridium sp. Marseille-P6806]